MHNIYVQFQGKIYSVPKVSEHDYITNENPVVHTLQNCSRYIDDLNIPNADDDICKIICNEIYPNDLEIVMTNRDMHNSTFLDLDIFIRNNKFHTMLYDKRRDFNFNVVTFPNLKSNIPKKTSYGIFIGELHRICKSSSEVVNFISEVKLLITKLVYQNFNKTILYMKLRDFLKSRPACLTKFWYNFNVTQFML